MKTIKSAPQRVLGSVGISRPDHVNLPSAQCRQQAVKDLVRYGAHRTRKIGSLHHTNMQLRLPTRLYHVSGWGDSPSQQSKHKALFEKYTPEDLSGRGELMTVILGSMNFLFHGYNWAYPKGFATLTLEKHAHSFQIVPKIQCSEVFLKTPSLLHALFGFGRDALDFSMRDYTLVDLVREQWTFDEIEVTFRSKDKELIRPIIETVLRSMQLFRGNRRNTPFSTKCSLHLWYLLDSGKNYLAYLGGETWRGSLSYESTNVWWESSHERKATPKFRAEIKEYVESYVLD